MKFRKKPYVVEAIQWFKFGDHPAVIEVPPKDGARPSQMKKFGWLQTSMGGHQIRVGDWIIRNPNGELSSCNPETFERIYEPVEEETDLKPRRRKSADKDL